MNIYLAGCKGDWREAIIARWPEVRCFDPFKDSIQTSIASFIANDLSFIRASDLLLAYHAYPVFDGLAVEVGYAHALGTPVIYVCLEPRMSSMILGVSKAAFTSLDAALDYIEERYLEDTRTDPSPTGIGKPPYNPLQ